MSEDEWRERALVAEQRLDDAAWQLWRDWLWLKRSGASSHVTECYETWLDICGRYDPVKGTTTRGEYKLVGE